MENRYSFIEHISIINSQINNKDQLIKIYNENILSDSNKWENIKLEKNVKNLFDNINNQIKKRMSVLSLGICNALLAGPGKNIKNNEEIYLFSAFAEIDTTEKIINSIMIENSSLVSPTLFHNSVHNTPLGYWTILEQIHNYTVTISDGLDTNLSFINFIKLRTQLDNDFIVTTGEEYSSFFELDKTISLKLFPNFAAFRVKVNKEKGFKFIGIFNEISEIIKNYNNVEYYFCDKNSYFELKQLKITNNILSEYPIVFDTPCSIIYRLLLPFYLDIKGLSLIIEKIKNCYYIFEVLL